jgi:CRP-like cAMP-binding protein
MYISGQHVGVELSEGNQRTFRFLTEGDWLLLMEKAESRGFEPGEVLIAQGGQVRQLVVVESGEVRIESRDSDGRDTSIARGGAGEVFGELSFLDREGASASVIADGPVTAHVIAEDKLGALLMSVPGLATRFYHSLAVELARRLREANARLARAGS